MGTNSKLNILIVTPFALWMYIICISNIIMQELSGAPYVAGIITYVSAFIIFLCYYWSLQNIRKMEDSEVFKMDTFLQDCWYCCIYSCRVYCLSIYKMNVMVNNKNLSKYGEYHGKRTNAY